MTFCAATTTGFIAQGAFLLLLSYSVITDANGQTHPPIRPLLANLTFPLDVSTAKVGSHVHARVIEAWSLGTCELRVGALVEGYVAQIQRKSKTENKTAIDIVFDKADCNRHSSTPFKTAIVAMLGPIATDVPIGQSGLGKAPALTGSVPLAIGGSGTAAPSVVPAPGSGFRSVEAAAAVNQYFAEGTKTRALPKQWTPGEVVDVPLTNLAPGAGLDGGSIIWAVNREVRLEASTTLIMMPTP